MIVRQFLLATLFCSIGQIAFGQVKSKDQSTSVESVLPEKEYAPKKKKVKRAGTTYDARNNYYDRQEMLGKQRLKNERTGNKPQYSDPEYFGHKRPPRKRPASKMKFCNVCGIRH